MASWQFIDGCIISTSKVMRLCETATPQVKSQKYIIPQIESF